MVTITGGYGDYYDAFEEDEDYSYDGGFGNGSSGSRFRGRPMGGMKVREHFVFMLRGQWLLYFSLIIV